MYTVKVYVTLKPSVLDPQGQAVKDSLHYLDYTGVEDVRMGKYMELQLRASDRGEASKNVEAMCERLLANPVIEQYRYEITEAKS